MPTSFDDYGTLSPYSDLYQPSAADLARNRAGGAADRPGFSHLGNSLGAMFFGGADREARFGKIYNEAATGEVRLQDLMLKARADRDAEIGRQGAIEDALAHGRTDIANMIRNSPNAASYQEAIGRGQDNAWGEESWKLANSAEGQTDAGIEQLVRQAGVRAPASMKDATKIEGGLGVSPFRTPGNQTGKFETPESIGLGHQHEAAAEASRTQALENTARTKFIEGPQTQSENALTGQRSREGRAATATADLPAADLAIIFSDGAGGKDDEAIKDFKIWMTDNNLSNERKSIGRYLKEQRGKAAAMPPPAAPEPEKGPMDRIGDLFGGWFSPRTKDAFKGAGGELSRGVTSAFDVDAGGPSAAGLKQPTSQAEFDSWPSGTAFINPKDGKPYTKK